MKSNFAGVLAVSLLPWLSLACSSEDAGAASSGGAPSSGGVSGEEEDGGSGGSSNTGGTTGGYGGGTGGTVSTGGETDPGDGSGMDDETPANRSAGCGDPTQQTTGSWVSATVEVGVDKRPYETRLPAGYDPERAYPVILLLHGCGSGTNNLPMENHTGSDAILVRGTGSGADTCWNDNQDLPFVDAMIEAVQARFCTDTHRVFAVGYSSGSWLAGRLSCVRADVFRGIATVAGGEPAGLGQCGGPVARMFVNDKDDASNRVAWAEPGRDRMIQQNQCDQPPQSDPVDPSPCVSYRACAEGYPVIWCETSGHGHSRRDDLAPAFWNFFKGLN